MKSRKFPPLEREGHELFVRVGKGKKQRIPIDFEVLVFDGRKIDHEASDDLAEQIQRAFNDYVSTKLSSNPPGCWGKGSE